MARRTDDRRGPEPARRNASLEAYLDTSAFIAFLDKSDSRHPAFRRLFSEPPALVTSALVIAEGHGWFLRRYDRHRATEFLAFIETLPDLTVQAFDLTEDYQRCTWGQSRDSAIKLLPWPTSMDS